MSPSRRSSRVFAFEFLELRRLLATDLLSDAVGLTVARSIEVEETSYFFADDGVHGHELWKSDDTIAGTRLVKDLTSGAEGSELVEFFECDGRLVFVTVVEHPRTNRFNRDYTVWTSDGSEDGTTKLFELKGVISAYFKQVGERVAFVANRTNALDNEQVDALLYFTDGTSAGTGLVREFLAKPESGAGDGRSYTTMHIFAAGDRVVFDLSQEFIWASDGTAAGTIDLTTAIKSSSSDHIDFFAILEMFEYDGKVWVPRAGNITSTDGTIAGTSTRTFAMTGGLEGRQSKMVGDTFYFINVESGRKSLKSYHIPSGTLTEIYSPTEMAGESYFLTLYKIGDHLLMNIINHTHHTGSLWGVQGNTVEKFADLGTDQSRIHTPVSLDGTTYFVLTEGDFTNDYDSSSGVPVGRVGSSVGGQLVYGGKPASVKVWRSDGTKAGTGVIRTLWEGDPTGTEIHGTLSTGTGVLLIRTEIRSGLTFDLKKKWDDLTVEWDDTLPYRPDELTMGRDVANARIVNGVLRLNGTPGPDRFRLHRPASDPGMLVVEVNDEARWFAFSGIRRIIADLQDGNDFLEIVEAPSLDIRLWTSVLGGDGADTILTATGRDTIIGGSGPDMIRSRGNADLIISGGGRDRITGGEGDDVINGGTGHDSVLTGTGNDVLFGQNAVERAFGQEWDEGDPEDDLILPSL